MLKQFNRFGFLGLSIVLLLGLSGCAAYRARPLTSSPSSPAQSVENDGISFAYRVFDKKDCRRFLDRDVLAQGYQPVHISITNKLNRPVYFDRKNISLATADANEVAELVHTNTVGRAVGYGVASIFMPLFLIPAIVDGIGSSRANEMLDADFNRKILRSQLINPKGTINGLIFVPVESFTSNFQIALSESENSQPIVICAGESQAKQVFA